MPYRMQKSGKGYTVVTRGTGKKHSKKPMSKVKAMMQMRAMYANMKKGEK